MHQQEVDMEEGEVVESDNENLKVPAETFEKDQAPQANSALFLRPKIKSSSDSESDVSDIDFGTGCNPNYNDKCKEHVTPIQNSQIRMKKKLDVWSSVMEDEILSGGLTSSCGVEVRNRQRNVESYDYTRAYLDTRAPKRQKIEDATSSNQPEVDFSEADLAVVETFGIASKPVNSKSEKSRKTRAGYSDGRHEKRLSSMMPIKKGIFQSNSSVEVVASELMTVLKEPKHMRNMFELVVKVIGLERVFKLLQDTEQIENLGGMMTLSGHRKRTAGGIFLHILKGECSKVEQDEIFIQERNERIERLKQKKEKKKKLINEKSHKLSRLLLKSNSNNSSSAAESTTTNTTTTTTTTTTSSDVNVEDDNDCNAFVDNIELDFC